MFNTDMHDEEDSYHGVLWKNEQWPNWRDCFISIHGFLK